MKRVIAFAPLALLLLIVAASAFVLMRGEPHDVISAGEPQRQAPSFALVNGRGGEMVTSDAYAGRAHLVNFFASWCTPCRAEHPQLVALQRQGVTILGIAYKDRPENAARFLQELGDPFDAVALDPDGRFALEIGVAGAVPETFVIDAQGRIAAVHRGPLTAEVIRDEIMPALGAR